MKPISYLLSAIFCLLLSSCASTKPNVDLTITDGKQVKHITGRIPAPSNPLTFVLGIGSDAIKYLFPAL